VLKAANTIDALPAERAGTRDSSAEKPVFIINIDR
jgi:hypothetical protein